MAAEARRACGYRKVGGTYLEAGAEGFACGRLPLALLPCPLCTHQAPFTRGLARITPREILAAALDHCASGEVHCQVCPLNTALGNETAGLLWVGDKFYTPESFTIEARAQGISKRVPWPLPKWLEIGRTWVFVAHPGALSQACSACRGTGRELSPIEAEMMGGALQEPLITETVVHCSECEGSKVEPAPGVFTAFIPRRVVRIIDDTLPVAEREKLTQAGLSLVEVPADDPDHHGGRRRDAE